MKSVLIDRPVLSDNAYYHLTKPLWAASFGSIDSLFITAVEGKKGLSDKSGSTDGFILIKISTLQIPCIISMTAYDKLPRHAIEMH